MTIQRASRRRATLRLRPFLACLLVAIASRHAGAVQPGDLDSTFDIDDDDPVRSIPTPAQRDANPLEFGYYLQNLVVRAEGAFEKRDWEGAVKYYEALARVVPDRAVSFSRLCTAYAALGKVDVAAANCGHALQLGGARVYDHMQFINISLTKKKLSPADIGDIEASLTHLREHVAKTEPAVAADSAAAAAGAPSAATALNPPADGERSAAQVKAEFLARTKGATPSASSSALGTAEAPKPTLPLPLELQVLDCKFAVRLRDDGRLDRCVTALGAMKADEKLIVPFEWSHALVDKDEMKAAAAIERARTLALPEPAVRAMLAEQAAAFPEKTMKRGTVVAIAATLGSILLALGVWWLTLGARRRKLEPTGPA